MEQLSRLKGQEFSEVSEVGIFNVIGEYAKSQGYSVKYFKVEMPSFNSNLQIELKYMYYVHVHILDKLVVSIYFDKYNLGSYMDMEYYELYDTDDIFRYGTSDEDEMELYDKAKELIELAKKKPTM